MPRRQFLLDEDQIPTRWYNIVADMKEPPPPPLNPATKEPIGPEALAPIFPMEIIKQEVSPERFIDIPEEVRDIYKIWRPTPLYRATRLEKALDTPAKIYYKYEGTNPSGSHKPNTAIAQAYYNKKEGTRRISTETGAGQWGSALSMACKIFGMECTVYMVRVSFDQKPYRKILMQTFGAEVFASPSNHTEYGRKVLAEDPDCPGSLGIAISEAIEDAATHDDVKYSLGSVLNHVCLHQTVIGEEVRQQMEMAGEFPDIVIGCCGGGSNFAGFAFPFMRDKLTGAKPDLRFIGAEPASCPSITEGRYEYDFGDTAGMTPLMKMKTLGHDFVPPSIHAGGLRYHGMSPIISALYEQGFMEAQSATQKEIFDAGVEFAHNEGILPAPESNHAIAVARREAIKCKEAGQSKVICFNLSGHGMLDLSAYDAYNSGSMG
ncbi:MAG: TrpB-like pyridoxal phosphate-dependent enzyme [Armatimonadetes bacterium]|nr:TrpB-like pyridoxal phosphate-dependent enzyme [Armatimonadota bacterium]